MFDFYVLGSRNSQWQPPGFEEAKRPTWRDGGAGLFIKPWETYVSNLSSQHLYHLCK